MTSLGKNGIEIILEGSREQSLRVLAGAQRKVSSANNFTVEYFITESKSFT